MQSRLFRFEIDRALINPVFQATDPVTGQPVFLYEWTPPASERDAAKQRLEQVSGDLACEVFTADASLYLAAPTREAAGQALLTLQAHDLFPGDWLDKPKALAVLEPVYLPEPALAAPFVRSAWPEPVSPRYSNPAPPPPFKAPAKKKNPATGCFLFILGFIIMVVAGAGTQSFSGAIGALIIYIFVVVAARRNSR